jgi:hypothetical protein
MVNELMSQTWSPFGTADYGIMASALHDGRLASPGVAYMMTAAPDLVKVEGGLIHTNRLWEPVTVCPG